MTSHCSVTNRIRQWGGTEDPSSAVKEQRRSCSSSRSDVIKQCRQYVMWMQHGFGWGLIFSWTVDWLWWVPVSCMAATPVGVLGDRLALIIQPRPQNDLDGGWVWMSSGEERTQPGRFRPQLILLSFSDQCKVTIKCTLSLFYSVSPGIIYGEIAFWLMLFFPLIYPPPNSLISLQIFTV